MKHYNKGLLSKCNSTYFAISPRQISIILAAVVAMVIVTAFPKYQIIFLPIVIGLFFILLTILLLKSSKITRYYTLLSVALRIIIVLAIYNIAPDLLQNDNDYYYNVSEYIARGEVNYLPSDISIVNIHPYFLSIFQSIFDYNITSLSIFIAIFCAMSVPLFAHLQKVIDLENNFALLVIAILPEFIIWTSMLYKDGVIYLVTLLFLISTAKIIKNGFKIFSVDSMILLVSIAIGGLYRSYQPILFTVTIALYSILRYTSTKYRKVLLVLIMLTSLSLISIAQMAGKLNLADLRQSYNIGNTVLYSIDAPVFVSLPLGITSLIFYPFPWLWLSGNISQIFASFTTVIWYYLFYILFKNFNKVLTIYNPYIIFLVSFIIVFAFSKAIIMNNSGALYRHKIELIFALLLIFSYKGNTKNA